MSYISKTFYDNVKDPLHIEESGSDVTLRISELGGPVSRVEFTKPKAIEVAHAILAAAGKQAVDISQIPHASSVSFNEAMLRVAAIHKRTVAFRYQKINGGYIESRRLNPASFEGDGEKLGVIGTDPDRGATRRFRLSQIQGEVSFA